MENKPAAKAEDTAETESEKIDTTPKTVETLKLSKPVKWEDEEIKELNMDFSRMTGDDLEAVEREWIMGGGGGVAETSKSFLMHIVARAAGTRVEVVRKMAIRDVSKATLMAQNFLLN